jgi:[ribosomal protein S18]-alanine N-acetyltransferase
VLGGLWCRLYVGSRPLALVTATPIRLRAMGRDDLPQVLSIEREAFGPTAWQQIHFENELEIPFAYCWTAFPRDDRGKVLGYLIYWLVASEVHLLNVTVASDVRRRGLGRRLVRMVQRVTRQKGCEVAFLEVAADNTAAVSLYRSLGFHSTQERRDYYGPGRSALNMEWRNR